MSERSPWTAKKAARVWTGSSKVEELPRLARSARATWKTPNTRSMRIRGYRGRREGVGMRGGVCAESGAGWAGADTGCTISRVGQGGARGAWAEAVKGAVIEV